MNHPDDSDPKASTSIPRRTFLAGAAATAGFTIVPRHVLGGQGTPAPSDKLNIAAVGVGGMGKNNVAKSATENIVALCDVDFDLAAEVFKKYPNAKPYKDFRVMLDERKDIDAVIIATPDHSHAVIAMAAMERKKHVYVQKPLTHSVYEARLLTETARKHGVVTQMGNQGHSGEGIRLLCEWVWDGAIGPIREAHAWTNRPVWPSGIEVDRPKETPEVPALLASLDALVVPSVWIENSPFVIKEAFAAGVPVVASNLGGMAELVRDGVEGLRFRAGNAADLARVMRRAAGSPELWSTLSDRLPVPPTPHQLVDTYRAFYDGIGNAAAARSA